MHLAERLSPPSAKYLLGTDELGRDILSRLIYGSAISMKVSFLVVGIAILFGLPLGAFAGYYGGKIDALISRITDMLLSIPVILLAILIIAFLGPGIWNAILAVGIAYIPYYIRVVRGAFFLEKNLEYVEAAKVAGASNLRIIFRHILPNTMAHIIVLSTIQLGLAILMTASLGYLGLGAQPPEPEWGVMISDAKNYLRLAPHLIIFPGLAIFFSVIGLNLLGDALRDCLDPRMR
jgi:peptide/nickel transport system permease protein